MRTLLLVSVLLAGFLAVQLDTNRLLRKLKKAIYVNRRHKAFMGVNGGEDIVEICALLNHDEDIGFLELCLLQKGPAVEDYDDCRDEFNVLWDELIELYQDDQGGVMSSLMKNKAQRYVQFLRTLRTFEQYGTPDTYNIKLNKFSIMTDAERKLFVLGNLTTGYETPDPREQEEAFLIRPAPPAADSDEKKRRKRQAPGATEQTQEAENWIVNWRDQGAVTAVKNQKGCSSCSVFAAVAVLEGAYFLAMDRKELKTFSEQQIIDCNPKVGCSGSWWPDIWDGVKKHKYIALRQDQPYKNKEGADCNRGTINAFEGAEVTGRYTIREDGAEEKMLQYLTSYGPITICVFAEVLFYYYADGVYGGCHGELCNHVMTLVGYDETTFLIKNQWGVDWGMDGYLKLFRGCTGYNGYSYWASLVYVVPTRQEVVDPENPYDRDPLVLDDDTSNFTIVWMKNNIMNYKDNWLSQGVSDGDIFEIKVLMIDPSNAKGFYYSFHIDDDVAIRADFLPKNNYVKYSMQIDNEWIYPKRDNLPATLSTIQAGETLVIKIKVTETGFIPIVNNLKMLEVSHVLTYTEIMFIELGGKAAEFLEVKQYRKVNGLQPLFGLAQTPCLDLDMYCSYYATQGYCDTESFYYEWMAAKCPRSCVTCLDQL